jgi:hypothetical protein
MNLDRQRLRLRFRKDEILMWTGHLDIMRLVIRLLHREAVPFATSGKFSPKPRITFGPPLALGVSADSELLDIELQEGVAWTAEDIRHAQLRLAQAAQPRDFVVALDELAPDAPTISQAAAAGRYVVGLAAQASDARALIERGELSAPGKGGQPVPAARGIVSVTDAGQALLIDGSVSGTAVFNVMRLAASMEAAGYTINKRHRVGLLDKDGNML